MTVVKRFPRRVRERPTVWIRMKDGARLAARIWMPSDARREPVPAILEYIPYRRRDATAVSDSMTHPYFAGHGYACVRVDMRGSGDSDGILHDEYLKQEHDDALEVIAWLARQKWCNGNVGMMGISWGGFNALQVAARRPPALKAIITVASTDDRYTDDIHAIGGCIIDDQLLWSSTMFVNNARPPDPTVVGDRWRAMWMDRLAHNDPWIIQWLDHQRYDAKWKHGSVKENYADIQCAVYAVGGWADGYTNAIPRLMAGLSCPRKALIGPWAHAYPHKANPGPAIGWLQDALRWWDHWLKGKQTGIMDEPMIRAWMQESVPPRAQYAERAGRWIAEAGWPSPHIGPRTYCLSAEGALVPGGNGREAAMTVCSPIATGSASGVWCPYGFDAEMPTDQREEDGRSLCFDSAPLAERTEIFGAPVVTLELAADKPVAMVAVRLNEVQPDGASLRVTYGVLNLTHRDGHENPSPLEPGRRYRVRVQLNDIAHAFPKGSRLRVAISSAYYPLAFPMPELFSLTVHAGASTLDLPVRAPRPEDETLAPFLPPETSPALAIESIAPAMRWRMVERDLATGRTTTHVRRSRGRYRIKDVDLLYEFKTREAYTVLDNDPTSAQQTAWSQAELERGDWRIKVMTRLTFACTRTHFIVNGTLEAFEGDRRAYSRTWDKQVPRDLV